VKELLWTSDLEVWVAGEACTTLALNTGSVGTGTACSDKLQYVCQKIALPELHGIEDFCSEVADKQAARKREGRGLAGCGTSCADFNYCPQKFKRRKW